MAFVAPRDRVLEYSTANSQTVFAVTGAADASFNRFSASMNVGDTTIGGVIEPGVAYRSCVLTYSNTNEITVTGTPFESKGTFSASGTKQVFMGLPAARALPFAAMAAHNVVVNPAVDVSQELGTTGATLVNNTAKYIADQWEAAYNHGAATAVVTSAQIAAGSFGAVLPGFQFGHQIKATTAISSPASGDFAKHRQKIEGYRVAHWGWGAFGAASIVVVFQLYSTGAGVAFVRLSNSAGDRFYYHEITVAAGWNFYAFTVAGDTSGTWVKDTGIGLNFEVFVSGKETTPQSALDAWGATAKVQTTNSTNLLVTSNNLTVLTGVYIDVGTQLPIAPDLPGLMVSYDQALKDSRRYFHAFNSQTASTTGLAFGGAYSTANVFLIWWLPVPMRVPPTGITVSAASDFWFSTGAAITPAATSVTFGNATNEQVEILGSVASGLTLGQWTALGCNSSSAKLFFTGARL